MTEIDDGAEFMTAYDILTMEVPEPSEHKFERLSNSQQAVSLIIETTRQFQTEKGLTVEIINGGASSKPLTRRYFTYHAFESAVERINLGEAVTLIAVENMESIIGYAIVSKDGDESNIDIIDVDDRFKRSKDFAKSLQVDELNFSVGVGQLLVLAALSHCPAPFRVDATHSTSRYVFKSLGFRADETVDNPCILIRSHKIGEPGNG